MKKFYITTSFFLLVGIIMTIYGLANNGAKTILIGENGQAEVFKENRINKDYSIGEIKNLKLELQNTVVNIVEGDKFSISQSANNTDQIKITDNNSDVTIKNGTDTQVLPQGEFFSVVGFFNSVWSDNSVTITVPSNTKIDKLDSDLSGGSLNIRGDVVDTLLMNKHQPESIGLASVNLGAKTKLSLDESKDQPGLNYLSISDSTIQGNFDFINTDAINMDITKTIFKNSVFNINNGSSDSLITIKDSVLENSQFNGIFNGDFKRIKLLGKNSILLENEYYDERSNQIHLTDIQDTFIKVDSSNLNIKYTETIKQATDNDHHFEINPKSKNSLLVSGESGQVYLKNIK